MIMGLKDQAQLEALKNDSLSDEIENGADHFSDDLIQRLSLITGIQKGIEILYPKEQWTSCLLRPTKQFDGNTLLDRMLGGDIEDLAAVRSYIDDHVLKYQNPGFY